MKKLAVTLLAGGLLFTGAGCSNDAPTSTANTTSDTTASTTPVAADTTVAADSFGLSVEDTANVGEARLQWTVPSSVDTKNKLRLINTAQSGREVGKGAFWQDVNSDATSYVWSNLISGKRFFRLCEVKDNACLQTSNEIEITVK